MIMLFITSIMSWFIGWGCEGTPSVKTTSDAQKLLVTMQDTVKKEGLEVATLGGGCFWCIEAPFDDLKGVEKAVSGYSGGEKENPTYQEVCYGNTGHAEVVNVYFDPSVISYEDILKVFFTLHDPTTLNRQGNDVGTQYRSAIFYHSAAQKQSAEKIINEIQKSGLYSRKIVTEVTKFTHFYPAENYHQEYYKLNGHAPYCQFVISPKMSKFRKEFKDRLKSEN
jgi:peptide-methionine (S)-S-oxide reductase